MRAKMPISERAKQFMPFSALKGYDSSIKTYNGVKEKKRILSEEDEAELNEIISGLKKGEVVKVVFWNGSCYETIVGALSNNDFVQNRLLIVKTYIPFSDIVSVERQ